MSRVLVTGGSGRIGGALVSALADAGHAVFAPTSAELDLRSQADANRIIDEFEPETIVHFGAVVPGRGDDYSLNAQSTDALLAAGDRRGVARLVLASSAAVYGDRRRHPVAESDELQPESEYARSKRDAEIIASRSDIQTVALRIFNVYGPTLTDSLIARLATSTPGSPVDVRDLDEFVRDYVAIDELAEFVVSVCGIELADDHTVLNVGSGVSRSNRQVVDELSTRHSLHFREVGGPPSFSVADIDRARALLGFAPSPRLREYWA